MATGTGEMMADLAGMASDKRLLGQATARAEKAESRVLELEAAARVVVDTCDPKVIGGDHFLAMGILAMTVGREEIGPKLATVEG